MVNTKKVTEKTLTLPEATTIWLHDLHLSIINSMIARKLARLKGKGPQDIIHAACTEVHILNDDPRLVTMTTREMLLSMGHADIWQEFSHYLSAGQGKEYLPFNKLPWDQHQEEVKKLQGFTSYSWDKYQLQIKSRQVKTNG